MKAYDERENLKMCTSTEVDELEFKESVAIAEGAKWTDTMYQIIQYIKHSSENDVSFTDINQTFPYI